MKQLSFNTLLITTAILLSSFYVKENVVNYSISQIELQISGNTNELKPAGQNNNKLLLPCCLTRGLQMLDQLYEAVTDGLDICAKGLEGQELRQCFGFWNGFQSAGEQYVESWVADCETGDPTMGCGGTP